MRISFLLASGRPQCGPGRPFQKGGSDGEAATGAPDILERFPGLPGTNSVVGAWAGISGLDWESPAQAGATYYDSPGWERPARAGRTSGGGGQTQIQRMRGDEFGGRGKIAGCTRETIPKRWLRPALYDHTKTNFLCPSTYWVCARDVIMNYLIAHGICRIK